MIDLGGGSVVLTPTISRLVRPGDKVVEILREEGVSLDELLDDLDEERERYYQERYAQN